MVGSGTNLCADHMMIMIALLIGRTKAAVFCAGLRYERFGVRVVDHLLRRFHEVPHLGCFLYF